MMFFFDRALLAMGNVLLLIGITLLLGVSKVLTFFADRRKLKGTAAFFSGIVLILMKWTFFGFIAEAFGIVVLFGDVIGTIMGVLRTLPVIGGPIGMLVDRIPFLRGGETLPV